MGRRKFKSTLRLKDLSRVESNDISNWKEIGLEAGGAREKKILQHPRTNRWFLVKFPKYGPFEIVTEIFNSILAQELGIHHVQYFPVIYKGREGVACQGFLDLDAKDHGLEDLWEMRELVCRHSGLSNTDKKFGRDADVLREHNIENIFLILEAEFGKSVLTAFFDMVGFDALIGHGDRHWGNYGFIISMKDNQIKAKFSPLYDTASGYLTEIKATEDFSESELVRKMLDEQLRDPSWYEPKIKGLCKITLPGDPKANHFDLLRWVLASEHTKGYRDSLAKPFRNFDKKLPRAILKRYFDGLSDERVRVIETILITRHRIGRKILSV